MDEQYAAVDAALRRAGSDGSNLCTPFRDGFAVGGAGLATLSAPFDIRMFCSSGETAPRLGELQIDIGEGPSWDAVASGRAVLAPDLENERRWPALTSALRGMSVGAIFAFPITSGTLTVGALCLDSVAPRTLGRGEVRAVETLAPLVATEIIRRVMNAGEDEDETASLREVHQATGMVMAQLRVPAEDALVAIRAHAFSTGGTVREVAALVVARTIDLSRDGA